MGGCQSVTLAYGRPCSALNVYLVYKHMHVPWIESQYIVYICITKHMQVPWIKSRYIVYICITKSSSKLFLCYRSSLYTQSSELDTSHTPFTLPHPLHFPHSPHLSLMMNLVSCSSCNLNGNFISGWKQFHLNNSSEEDDAIFFVKR